MPVTLHFAKRCVLGVAATLAVIGPLAIGLSNGSSGLVRAQEPGGSELKHYESSEWKFDIDIPRRWHAFPPVSGSSPYEVVRFESREAGNHHLIIVFRAPYDPKERLSTWAETVQQNLAKDGFLHFVTGETTIGSRRVATLDFDKRMPHGTLWSCREYFVPDGTLLYTLGFGTNQRDEMFGLFDQIAKSFVSHEASE